KREPAGPVEERLNEHRALVDEMLAIVENEQHLLIGQVRAKGVHQRSSGPLPQSERRRDRQRNTLSVGERREVNEPDAVRKAGGDAESKFDGKSRLANTADPGERQEPRGFERRLVFSEI